MKLDEHMHKFMINIMLLRYFMKKEMWILN